MSALPKTYQIGHKIIHHLHQDFDAVRGQLGQFKNSLHLQGLMHGSTGALGHLRHDLMVGSATLVLLAVLSHTPEAKALPTGANMTSGHAWFTQTANSLVIYQNSWDAVIDWTSFNLGANESVQFYVPTPTSSTLNRINDPNPSTIAGSITSNGNLFFVNKNGMVFTGTSSINAPVIGLSTSDILINATDVRTQYNSTRVFSSLTPTSGSISLAGTVNATYQLKLTAQNVTMAGAITTHLNPTQGLGIDVKATNNITVGSTARISAVRYASDSLVGLNADHDITVAKGAQISAIASNNANLAAITMTAGGSVYQHGDLLVQKHGGNNGKVKISSTGNMEFDAGQFSEHASVELIASNGSITLGGSATYDNFTVDAAYSIFQSAESAMTIKNLSMTSNYGIELVGQNSIENITSLTSKTAGNIIVNNTGSTNFKSLRAVRGNITLSGGTFTVNSGAGVLDADQDIAILGRIEVRDAGALTLTGQSIYIDNAIHGQNGFTGNPLTINISSWQGSAMIVTDTPWGRGWRKVEHTSPQGISFGSNGSVTNIPVIKINDHNSAFTLDDSLSRIDTFNYIITADGTFNYNLSRNLDSINVTANRFVQTAGNNLHIFHVTLNVTDSATLDGANNYIKQLGTITNTGTGNVTINTTTPLSVVGQVNINTGRFDVTAGSILLNRFVNINSKGAISLNGAGGIEVHNEVRAKAIELNSQGTIWVDLISYLRSTDDINLNSFSQLTNNGVIVADRDLFTRGNGAITVTDQFGTRYGAVHIQSQGSVLFAAGSRTFATGNSFSIENGNSSVQLFGQYLEANDVRIVSGGVINFNNGMLNTNNLHIVGTSTTQFNLGSDMNLNMAGEVSIRNQGNINIAGNITAGGIEVIGLAEGKGNSTLTIASGANLTAAGGLTLINRGYLNMNGNFKAVNMTVRANGELVQAWGGSVVLNNGWLTLINESYSAGTTMMGSLTAPRIGFDLHAGVNTRSATMKTNELQVTAGGIIDMYSETNEVKSLIGVTNNGYGYFSFNTETDLAINGNIELKGGGNIGIIANNHKQFKINTITIGSGVTSINSRAGGVNKSLYSDNTTMVSTYAVDFGGKVVAAARTGNPNPAMVKAGSGGVWFVNGQTGLLNIGIDNNNSGFYNMFGVNGVNKQTLVLGQNSRVRKE